MNEPADRQGNPEAADVLSDVTQIEDVTAPSPTDERVAEMMAHSIDVPVLAEAVDQQEAADAADVLETLEDAEAVEVLERMEDLNAAQALAEMQPPLALTVLEDLIHESEAYAGRLVELMAPDDAADILQLMEMEERQRLLRLVPLEFRRDLIKLLDYDEESAGGLMTTDFLHLNESMTVQAATDFIRTHQVPDHTQYLPVIDDARKLVGIIGLRHLLLARPSEPIDQAMNRSVKAIHADVDREQVASEFDRYDLSMLPVIDDDDCLLGIVTVDDVIDIIREEQTEDVQKTVGAGKGEAVYSPVAEKFKGRFPWMAASLVMMCGSATVILLFESLVEQYTVLAFLLPVTAALVGNAGHQSLAVTLRGIILDEVRPGRVTPLIIREMVVGVLMGFAIGLLMCGIVGLLAGDGENRWQIGLIAGAAVTLAMAVGTLAGSSIPLLMQKLGFDPAQSSAIFLIMITDGVSFSFLLGMMSVLL